MFLCKYCSQGYPDLYSFLCSREFTSPSLVKNQLY
uniref:Uncharacterized protein n=1 Tax=Rhizophora mucronata TaxID=61149 RepID=A0A2P2Q1X8_RHIMU